MGYCTKKDYNQIWCAAVTKYGAYNIHYYKIQQHHSNTV